MWVKLAYDWREHKRGETIEVSEKQGRSILRQGKGRETKAPKKLVKKQAEKVETTIWPQKEPEGSEE